MQFTDLSTMEADSVTESEAAGLRLKEQRSQRLESQRPGIGENFCTQLLKETDTCALPQVLLSLFLADWIVSANDRDFPAQS